LDNSEVCRSGNWIIWQSPTQSLRVGKVVEILQAIGSQREQAGLADAAVVQTAITGDKHHHYNMPIVEPLNEYVSIPIKACSYCFLSFSRTYIINRILFVWLMFSMHASTIPVDWNLQK
jgi:hypothetical protein